jgi:hypothetical protein
VTATVTRLASLLPSVPNPLSTLIGLEIMLVESAIE